jgi:hypothetical protein
MKSGHVLGREEDEETAGEEHDVRPVARGGLSLAEPHLAVEHDPRHEEEGVKG